MLKVSNRMRADKNEACLRKLEAARNLYLDNSTLFALIAALTLLPAMSDHYGLGLGLSRKLKQTKDASGWSDR